MNLRRCIREPIPEIAIAAEQLSRAADSYVNEQHELAAFLIRQADLPAIREWTESIWGKNSPYIQYQPLAQATVDIPKEQRIKVRMPNTAEKRSLHERDGYHCRFCGIPVIRKEVRLKLTNAYPQALSWTNRNTGQHAAFQAMWAQYDHILPHARGGTNDLNNIVVTCAPCNFGRMNYTLEEVGICDPRSYQPKKSMWDGLERILSRS